MSKKIAFVLELTEDEAVDLCLLYGGGYASGLDTPDRVLQTIDSVNTALSNADKHLYDKQYAIWKNGGQIAAVAPAK